MLSRILAGLSVALAGLVLSACGGGASSVPSGAVTSGTSGVPAPSTQVTLQGAPPASITVGSAYSFRPVVTPSAGVAFSIAGQPAWITFNAATGAMTGTPGAGDVGTTAQIVITATNGSSKATLGPFTIQVVAATGGTAPQPPTISGTPVTSVTVGSSYSFTPTTTDPSGGTLTFSIQNAPSWVTFDASTGQMAGTPGSGNVGKYANIAITVTDGLSSASLSSFSITVIQPANGTAKLTWVPPTQNTDGTPLTDLAGFYVEYGTSQSAMTQSVQIASPTTASYTVQNLAPGTWYFTVVAYTSTGLQSSASGIASKTIQ